MDSYERALHRAILTELGITEPPYRLKIESNVGSVTAALRDDRNGTNDFGEGDYVGGHTTMNAHPQQLAEAAKEIADELRPHLKP